MSAAKVVELQIQSAQENELALDANLAYRDDTRDAASDLHEFNVAIADANLAQNVAILITQSVRRKANTVAMVDHDKSLHAASQAFEKDYENTGSDQYLKPLFVVVHAFEKTLNNLGYYLWSGHRNPE